MTANPRTPKTLISAESLRALQASADPALLVDVSFDLADVEAGRRAWQGGHLPGSVYLHLDDDLSAPKTGANGRHPLPDRPAFAALLGRIGVTPQSAVVALDAQGGVYAARLWWMLRWIGHADAAVLDGGVAAWQRAGGPLVTDQPSRPSVAPYPERTPLTAQLDATELARRLGRLRLLDARAPERFRGEVEPLDAVAGHIPGATNRFHRLNLDADGRFKPASQLRAEFEALLGADSAAALAHQCGSGVTACHNLLAMEHAGLAGSALYPGSWSEWSADSSRPVARG
ncbi:MAG: sulfurtransferase [Pseudomonadota bacterium]|nr:sulfurtransferase [Pseudomonadota bacterium]